MVVSCPENADGIELNVSHAGSLTVLAAAQSKPGTNLKLGVDVMLLTDRFVHDKNNKNCNGVI